MKKIFLTGAFMLGAMGLYSCGDQGTTTAEDEIVVEQDTTVSELEVERTVIETDTVTETETIERDQNQ